MYVPSDFSVHDPEELLRFIETYPFAALTSRVEDRLFATHLPFLVERGRTPATLYAHMARANPHWKSLSGQESMIVFTGPHTYVSPSWYVTHPSVPTWNYTAIHVYGRARIIHDLRETLNVLGRLTNRFEAQFPKPWRVEDLSPKYAEDTARGIVAFEIEPTHIEGKYKLSQNRTRADRQGVIDALQRTGELAAGEVARLMRRALNAGPGL